MYLYKYLDLEKNKSKSFYLIILLNFAVQVTVEGTVFLPNLLFAKIVNSIMVMCRNTDEKNSDRTSCGSVRRLHILCNEHTNCTKNTEVASLG